MADEAQPLTDEERAELEALRAEKAVREARELAERERAELEALRAERTQPAPIQLRPARRVESADDRRIREARERGARLMEPDDDLRMPIGQKVVLAVLALLVGIIVVMHFLVG